MPLIWVSSCLTRSTFRHLQSWHRFKILWLTFCYSSAMPLLKIGWTRCTSPRTRSSCLVSSLSYLLITSIQRLRHILPLFCGVWSMATKVSRLQSTSKTYSQSSTWWDQSIRGSVTKTAGLTPSKQSSTQPTLWAVCQRQKRRWQSWLKTGTALS